MIGINRRHLRLLPPFARTKLAALRAATAFYLPSLRPVGRGFSVASGLSTDPAIAARKVLPERKLQVGTDEWVDVPPLHVYALEGGRLITDVRTFKALLVGNTIINEVSADFKGKGQRGVFPSVTGIRRLPAARSVGPVASLLSGFGGGGAPNYFHWLYDLLPRTRLIEQSGLRESNSRYVVPTLKEQYQADTLDLLGISLDDCLQIDGPTVLDSERIVVSEGHRRFSHVEPWVCEFLRERVGQPSAQSETGRRMHIYISRRDTQYRKVLNEDRLEAALASRGIESVSLAGRSFREQVQLFQAADVIVAAHGAGLANIVFSRPGTRVVEIAGGGQSWPLFEGVGRAVGLVYHTVEGLEAVGSRVLPSRVRDTRVDLSGVLAAVDDMLSGGGQT